MQRTFLILLAATAALGTATVEGAKRNVVLVVGADHGRDAGCYGNPAVRTPSLDRLAADGVRFDYAFCTTSSCSASRSVILTGLYNHATGHYGHEHGYNHFRTYENLTSLPVLLGEAGYRTCRIGKYHVAPEAVYQFDQEVKANPRNGVEMADRCVEFLKADDPRPFFLYFCVTDPHRGGGSLKDVPYEPNRFGNQDQGYPGVEEIVYDPGKVIVPSCLPDTPECRQELAQYYQAVSRLDQGVGRLVQRLQEAGVYDDTLLVYISDNGIPFPGAKTTVYEPGLRLPCIARNPYSNRRGNVSNAMITWADLAPTILDFCEVKTKRAAFHGRSFLAAMEQDDPPGFDEIYASHTFHEITNYYPMRVVRGRQYKLIWNIANPLPYPFASDLWAAAAWQGVWQRGEKNYGRRTVDAYLHRPRFELYDLQADPDELHNLAGDPKYAQVLAELQGKLKDFQKRTKDPWVLKWDYE
ncbi:MAG: sulfatase family protein [Thermoguttaceae bacterium]